MRKFFSLLATMALGATVASALPFGVDGYVQVAHGWVKDSSGKKVSIKGMVFPYRIEPIQATNLTRQEPKDKFLGKLFERNSAFSTATHQSKLRGRSGPEADQTIYQADAGTGYGYVELNPSSLDDITISSAGLNKPWQKLTFGFNYGSTSFSNFLIRWRIWKDRIDNPAPQNDFANEIADFGVIWNQSVPQGSHKVEILIAQAGVVSDDATLYMAQQFRDASNLQGEGAFEFGIDTIFNAAAPPNIGTSENQFWYDWDPADGNYEDTEIDVLEGGALSNHLWVIKTSDTASSTQVFPVQVTVQSGTQVGSGNVFSLWFPFDNDMFRVEPTYMGARTDPNQRVIVEGLVPTSNLTSIRIQTVSSAEELLVRQRLYLWNYVGQAWILVDTRFLNTLPTIADATYGGLIPVGNFVGPGNRVRMKIESERTDFSNDSFWNLNLDQVNWYVTRP